MLPIPGGVVSHLLKSGLSGTLNYRTKIPPAGRAIQMLLTGRDLNIFAGEIIVNRKYTKKNSFPKLFCNMPREYKRRTGKLLFVKGHLYFFFIRVAGLCRLTSSLEYTCMKQVLV